MEKCSRSLVLAGGASVAVVEALSRVSTAYRSSLLVLLEASAAAQHAGGFLPASSGRYAVHCLADPNYTISYDRKRGIWGGGAFISGQFGHVYCRSSFFRSPTAAARKLLGISTNVFLCHACYTINRPH